MGVARMISSNSTPIVSSHPVPAPARSNRLARFTAGTGRGRASFVSTAILALLPLVAILAGPATLASAQTQPEDRTGPLIEIPDTFAGDSTTEYTAGLGHAFVYGSGDDQDELIAWFGLTSAFANWRVQIELPVHMRYEPFQPDNNRYNEISDWFTLIREIRYGSKGQGNAFFLVGELTGEDATLGYGWLLHRYDSLIDLDSPTIGLQSDLDFDQWGYEIFLNSITEADVLGARLYMRPLRIAGVPYEPIADFELAGTVLTDWNAPESLSFDGSGNVNLNAKRNIQASRNPVLLASVDMTFPFVRDAFFEFAPYVGGAAIMDNGVAAFAGIDTRFYVGQTPVDLRLEYQQLSRGYLPNYVDTFYRVERFSFPTPAADRTKQQAIRLQAPTVGFVGEFRTGVEELFEVRLFYSTYLDDVDDQLGRLIAEVRTLPGSGLPFQLSAAYVKRGVDRFSQAFTLDDSALLRVDLVIHPVQDVPLRFGVSAERAFRIEPATGRFGHATRIMPYLALAFRW